MPAMAKPLLGCLADDFTGATDLANTLVRGGMRTFQTIGVPAPDWDEGDADALVVALKSRTIPAPDAVTDSLRALDWLRQRGIERFFFKYCSTFDSTDRGNIGPVADALLDALGAPFTIFCPAFPATGRTIYQGHLFVGDVLLSDSPMRSHPLTPMTDASLVRVLGRQTARRVGLVPYRVVARGAPAIEFELDRLAKSGVTPAIVDALADDDLVAIGTAARALPLVTGGSGLAIGLPATFARDGQLALTSEADALPAILPLAEAKEKFQRDYINEILALNNGNRTKTARDLGVDPRTIFRHLEKEDADESGSGEVPPDAT